VIRQFDYPQQFAEDIFDRIEQALANPVARTGRLVILPGDDPHAHRAVAYDEAQLLSDRREGRCLLSYQTPAGWVAISKTILTDVLGEGHDATIAGLPPVALEALELMYPSFTAGSRRS
jgi:hypothetical protein